MRGATQIIFREFLRGVQDDSFGFFPRTSYFFTLEN